MHHQQKVWGPVDEKYIQEIVHDRYYMVDIFSGQ